MKNSIPQDSRRQDVYGTATVQRLVQGEWGHGWQTFDPTNDNGIDGIIIKRKRGVDTGNIIYVQVKCGTEGGYLRNTENRKNYLSIHLGKKYILSHRPRWNSLPGSVVLVFVHYKSGKSWWTDLKSNDSYTEENESIILIPKKQVFGQHSIGEFKKLVGYLFATTYAGEIIATREDVNYINLTQSLKSGAKAFYKTWGASSERNNPELGEVIVSREGWRHITKSGRRVERIFQSWQLLGIAKRIIQTVGKAYQLRQIKGGQSPDGTYLLLDYISLRANVNFPHRQSAIIQVVLRRHRQVQASGLVKSQIWFHSVFEPLAREKASHKNSLFRHYGT